MFTKGCRETSMPSARCFAANHQAVLLGCLAAEGGGHAHGGRLALRGMAGEHARRPVGKAQTRNAQPRNAGQVAGLALVDRRIFLCAVDQCQLLVERHLAQQLVYPRVAGHHRHTLAERRTRAQRQYKTQHGHRWPCAMLLFPAWNSPFWPLPYLRTIGPLARTRHRDGEP